jgi:hypothetical protein
LLSIINWLALPIICLTYGQSNNSAEWTKRLDRY